MDCHRCWILPATAATADSALTEVGQGGHLGYTFENPIRTVKATGKRYLLRSHFRDLAVGLELET